MGGNYRSWGQYRPLSPKQAMEESEYLDLIPTGIGGVLYPRECFNGTQVLNVNAIWLSMFLTLLIVLVSYVIIVPILKKMFPYFVG